MGDIMNFVNFRIASQNIDLKEVNKYLNIIPTHICKKGDTHYDKITKKTFTYSENVWTYDIKIENLDETEDKISEFIDLFYQSKEYIQRLAVTHKITLWVTVYQETYQYNLHFSKSVLGKISELGIDVDITCMQLQEFYTEQENKV